MTHPHTIASWSMSRLTYLQYLFVSNPIHTTYLDHLYKSPLFVQYLKYWFIINIAYRYNHFSTDVCRLSLKICFIIINLELICRGCQLYPPLKLSIICRGITWLSESISFVYLLRISSIYGDKVRYEDLYAIRVG